MSRQCCCKQGAIGGVLIVGSLVIGFALRTSTDSDADARDIGAEFATYAREHDRGYLHDSEEYANRLALFSQRFRDIQQHNAGADGLLWTEGVNTFTDQTDDELSHSLGWRHLGGQTRRSASDSETTSFVDLGEAEVHPVEKSWGHLKMAHNIMDQGHCGSCWAVAAVTVLAAHHEISGSQRSFSVQELVSCVSNPLNCGGKGQCDGATVELAMDWVMARGLQTDGQMPYTASNGKCDRTAKPLWRANTSVAGKLDSDDKIVSFPKIDNDVHAANPKKNGLSVGLIGYKTLKKNNLAELMSAIQTGPVAISVAAATWFAYRGGIFVCSSQNPVVNHAVVLFGYGHSAKGKYWLIRNSWGPLWGERGFIRIRRLDQGEQNFCGADTKPKEGVACDTPHPRPTVQVCGSCGILYDSVIPQFARPKSKASIVEQSRFDEGSRPVSRSPPHEP